MSVRFACTLRARLRGLHGSAGFDGALLLAPCNDIHTFGMPGPIDVAFVGADGTVLEARRGVAPNRRVRNRRAVAAIERFARSGEWFSRGDSVLFLVGGSSEARTPGRD